MSSLQVRLSFLLMLVAAALVLTSCLGVGGEQLGSADQVPSALRGAAGSTDEGSQAAVLAAAATKTTETGSAKLNMSLAIALPGTPERVEVGLAGTFDFANHRGRFVFDYGSLVEALGPTADQVGALLPDRLIFESAAIYLRMPNLSDVVPEAKKWVKFDVETLDAQPGLSVGGVDQLGQANPTQLLGLLESLEGSIEDLGVDEVRGEPATHYRATINMSKLAATASQEQKALLEGQLEKLAELGLDSMPVEVWTDGEGRVVGMSSTIAVPDTGTGPGTVSFNVELYDFGARVKIKTPAATRVSGVETLLGALASTVQG